MIKLITFLVLFNSYAHKLPPAVEKIVNEVRQIEGDKVRGKEVYSLNCASCHGQDGVPYNNREAVTPYVADQTPTYLAISLASFKTGHRDSSTMEYIAKRLTSQDMADIISFVNSEEVSAAHCDEKILDSAIGDAEHGEVLFRKEREFKRPDGSSVMVSCTMCHGQNGVMPESVREKTLHPDVAALGEHYLRNTLSDYRDGMRVGGPMGLLTADLSDQDIADLSAFISRINRCNKK
jgi:cytochrome c553